MRLANLALKFVLELAAFIALGYTGAALGAGVWGFVLAVAMPAIAIGVWARWNAPRSSRRLPTRTRAPLELAVFVTAGVGLVLVGAVAWAVALLIVVAINAALMTAWNQWEA